MLPAFRSGNTSTLAWPATGEPGALLAPTLGTRAASTCISPSTSRSGRRAWTYRVASTTLSTSGSAALPLVENESIATRGVSSRNIRHESAAAMAMSANWLALGLGTTPQSV